MNKILVTLLFLGTLLGIGDSQGGYSYGESRVMGLDGCHSERQKRESEARNKAAVIHVTNELFGNHNIDILDVYHSAEKYIQHNPTLPDGREALKRIARQWFEGVRKEPVYIHKVSAEDDLVWIHYRVNNFTGKRVAIVDIFRWENEKIVEHWDVIQEIGDPRESLNDHPFF